MLKGFFVFLRRQLNRIRCGQRYTAMAACALLRAKPLSARILGLTAVLLLLPGTIPFAPRVLTRCPCLSSSRGT